MNMILSTNKNLKVVEIINFVKKTVNMDE